MKRFDFRVYLVLALALAAFAASASGVTNVVLFIGDGMSVPQRMMADEFARKAGLPELAMNRLPHQALTRTCSADATVTDSAAAATAIACGTKTRNHVLGLDAEGRRLESCAEVAKRHGRRVGIVTTVTINHATPGGFYAHRKARGMDYDIGLDLVASGFDYFAGGGMEGHNDRRNKHFKGDIYELWKQGGNVFLREDMAAFRALAPSGQRVWYVASSREMPYAIDSAGNGRVPTLAELTAKGLELLENEKGFFLMVEAGKIDHACHINDPAPALRDTLALDDAVRVALDYQRRHPDTLVIVTGDHETGGLTLGRADTGYTFPVERLAGQTCSTGEFKTEIDREHPADFAALKPIIERCFGLKFSGKGPIALSAQECSDLEQAFLYDLELARKGKKDDARYDAAKITHLPAQLRRIMSARGGVGWTTGSHTALPVLTTASGPGSERIAGYLENTDISRMVKEVVGK